MVNFKKKLFFFTIIIMCIYGFLNSYLFYEKYGLYQDITKKVYKFEDLSSAQIDICPNQDYNSCFKNPRLVKENELHTIYIFINKLLSDKDVTFSWCHSVSHIIGANYYDISGELEKVFSTNLRNDISDLRCLSGFYHGAMIQAMKKGEDKNLQEIKKIFAAYQDPQDFLESEVLHGIGHAFYAYYGDIEKGLSLCKEHTLSLGQKYLCDSGVFMQFFFEANEYDLSIEVDYCDKFTGTDKFSCISGFVPVRILQENIKRNLLEYCTKLETKDMLIACYERQLRIYHSFKNSDTSGYEFVSSVYNNKKLLEGNVFLALASRNAEVNYCVLAGAINYFICKHKLAEFDRNNYYVFIPASISSGWKKGKFF